jgi:hypothetical protein
MATSSSKQFCVYACLIATALFIASSVFGHTALTRRIADAISSVRTERTVDAKTRAAEQLAKLVRSVNPNDVDQETLNQMISLLDSPDDSVRAWVAGSLGYLGQRAKSAVPKLLSVLPKSDCLNVDLSSAPAIRLAIKRIGATAPPAPKCPSANR